MSRRKQFEKRNKRNKIYVNNDGKFNNLIKSMTYDELLEASNVAELSLKGEYINEFNSDKAKKIALRIRILDNNPKTKDRAIKTINFLSNEIVHKNEEAFKKDNKKRVYRAVQINNNRLNYRKRSKEDSVKACLVEK